MTNDINYTISLDDIIYHGKIPGSAGELSKFDSSRIPFCRVLLWALDLRRWRIGPFDGPAIVKPTALPGDTYISRRDYFRSLEMKLKLQRNIVILAGFAITIASSIGLIIGHAVIGVMVGLVIALVIVLQKHLEKKDKSNHAS